MRVKITNRDFACHPGIVHRKSRVQIADPGVPGDLAFTNKFRYDGRPIALDRDANWNTVSAFTGSRVLTSRTPKPAV